MLFKDKVTAHLDYLHRMENLLKNKLKTLPDGNMFRKQSKGKFYYYEMKNGQITSLQKNPRLLEEYQIKESTVKTLEAISENIQNLEQILKDYRPLVPAGSDFSSYESEQNTNWSEDKRTLYRGTYYRSKSEAMIASMLTSYRIPFKYEVCYSLNGYKIYPDFLIERPRDKKLFIWEHFGKIENEEYDKKTFYKLQDYHNAGIDLWDNLIASFDQYSGGIDVDYIDKIIKLYLL